MGYKGKEFIFMFLEPFGNTLTIRVFIFLVVNHQKKSQIKIPLNTLPSTFLTTGEPLDLSMVK
jgi:hypothetical protein